MARTYLLAGDRPVVYVGYTGARNVGDDAIFEVHRRSLRSTRFVEPVKGRLAGPLARASAKNPRSPRALLLGGGTIIGKFGWLARVRPFLEGRPDAEAFMLGAGVEDLDFAVRKGLTSEAELERWAEVLDRFDRVTVRGPQSVDSLSHVGVKASIVGDPALLLPTPSVEPHERLLGVNVSMPESMWGEPEPVYEAVAQACRQLVSAGWRIRIFQFRPLDQQAVEHVARAVGGDIDVYEGWHDLDALVRAIATCHVFVGERLHSVVLSSVAHVPSLMLEYRPKCRDFQASIGRERYTVRTDRIDATALLAHVDELADRDRHAEAIATAVEERREQLRAEQERVTTRLLPLTGRP